MKNQVMLLRRGLIVCSFLFGILAHAGAWEFVGEDRDVKVYKKDIKGSRLVAFRGETVINASMNELLWVLLDNDHRTDWVGRLKTSTFLENNTPYEYVVHQEFNMPWPISNRDFVYRGKAILDKKTGSVHLKLKSEDHPKSPKTTGVRAILHHSEYVITPMKDGKTRVEVEINSDPKGMIPKFIVNLIQRSWPANTLAGIRTQVAKNFVRPIPLPKASGSFLRISPT